MHIGYARVSTDDQHLHLQRDALEKAGCKKIYEDKTSGAKATRPGLELELEVAREDDVLVIWRLDRLGRSLKDLIHTTWKVNGVAPPETMMKSSLEQLTQCIGR